MDLLISEDFPLFNGDLLSMGLPSVAPLNSTADQLLSPDGSPNSSGLQDEFIWPTVMDNSAKDPVEPSAEIAQLLATASSPASDNQDILSSDWMDMRIDLSSIEQVQLQPEVQPELLIIDSEPMSSSSQPVPLDTISESDVSALLENFGQESLPTTVSSLEVGTLATSQMESPVPPFPAATDAPPVDMFDVLAKLANGMDNTLNELEQQPEVDLSCDLVLSPMSLEEVENILSSEPCSPQHSSASLDDSSFIDQASPLPVKDKEDANMSELARELQKAVPSRQKGKARGSPYKKPSRETKASERKERKKQQNKDAALRYRLKKKAESSVVLTECEQLEIRNKELHDKVDTMTREINYLKSLMSEVYKAKGLLKTSPSAK